MTYAGPIDEHAVRERVEKLRADIDHPVVDGDGHLVEAFPMLIQYLERVSKGASGRLVEHLAGNPITTMGNANTGDQRGAWWGVPNNARDLATVMAPKLLAERMDELGLDFTVIYPTMGLALVTLPDDDMRRVACRALNTMLAEMTADVQDLMTPVAAIPMNTPEEAIEELEYATQKLGLKAAMIAAGVARPWPEYPDAFPTACFMDRYGVDSHYDYDPVWKRFVELGVAVTAHGGVGIRFLECGRRSPTNYMYNHILAHAYQMEELAKSLVMGGVTQRFPTLNFAFLEGGVGWACDLLHALVEHWEKRNGAALANYDPKKVDRDALGELLEKYGLTRNSATVLSGMNDAVVRGDVNKKREWVRDEFETAQITDEEDFGKIFSRQFFFGCEGDDRGVYRALDGTGNTFGLRLNAIFSSDIGHWDVPHLSGVVLESHGLVDQGILSADDYRDFAFVNPVKLHTGMNPKFFEGTKVEKAVSDFLATQ